MSMSDSEFEQHPQSGDALMRVMALPKHEMPLLFNDPSDAQHRIGALYEQRDIRAAQRTEREETLRDAERKSKNTYQGAPCADNEPERLSMLRSLSILDSDEDENFDRITELATTLFGVKAAIVSLVDEHRQWFKSVAGIATKQTCRNEAFCAFTIQQAETMVVVDTLLEDRFKNNPLVVGPPYIRFYAGVPLNYRGFAIGTLCVIDTKPNLDFDERKKRLLIDLSKVVLREIEVDYQREKTRRETQIQKILSALVSKNLETSSLNELLDSNLIGIAEVLQADFVHIMKFNEDGKTCSLQSGFGWNDEYMRPGTTIDLESIAQRLLDMHERSPDAESFSATFVLGDSAEQAIASPRFSKVSQQEIPEFLRSHGVRSGICALLSGKNGKPIGIIGAYDRHSHVWRDYDAGFLTSCAASLTMLIGRIEDHILITEKNRQLEKWLLDSRKNEDNLMALLSSLPIGIITVNEEGTITYINNAWNSAFGTNDHLGRPAQCFSDITFDWRKEVAENSVITREIQIERNDGSLFYGLLRVTAFAFSVFREGYICTFTDITERLEREKISTLEKSKEDMEMRARIAEENKAAYAEFVEMICHQILNPLNGIFHNVDFLLAGLRIKSEKSGVIASNDKEALEAILLCGSHQKAVVTDLLNLAMIESGKLTITDSEFSLVEVMRSLKAIFETQVSLQGIQLDFCVPIDDDAEEPLVIGDKMRVLQILENLVANAVRWTLNRATKRITVSLITKNDDNRTFHTVFGVKDTGSGMSVEDAAKIFDKKKESQSSYGSSGLGLVISKQLAIRMGGDITCETELGTGTSFSFSAVFSICNKRLSKRSYATDFSPEPTPRRKERKILVVEDNTINQKVVIRHLRAAGHICSLAKNGLEAVETVQRSEKFDLIIMDIEMPVMDGIQACRAIRQFLDSKRDIPIVALSGNARPEQIQSALDAGMQEFLAKPYNKEVLINKVELWAD